MVHLLCYNQSDSTDTAILCCRNILVPIGTGTFSCFSHKLYDKINRYIPNKKVVKTRTKNFRTTKIKATFLVLFVSQVMHSDG